MIIITDVTITSAVLYDSKSLPRHPPAGRAKPAADEHAVDGGSTSVVEQNQLDYKHGTALEELVRRKRTHHHARAASLAATPSPSAESGSTSYVPRAS
ncbi:hypothetical protein [Streptomyces aureocirculatus]|uniref:hypothetical protein n=1 Tax=Streptomyces aureocirculatus TaxID=67275 RepID=UPI000A933968|nr:hypothetical protein [Streptomyces aureocirculatus]